jgi:hypothetical protein
VHPAEEYGGKTAKPVSKLKTVHDLAQKFEAVKRARQAMERQWKLNLAFYKGKQYSFFPPRSDRLESLATDEGEKPRHRVRIVSNQIIVGSLSLRAQLTKTRRGLVLTTTSRLLRGHSVSSSTGGTISPLMRS